MRLAGSRSRRRKLPLAVVAGLFAFGGWHMVTYAAEETRDPERTIPRALVVGVLIVTVCYIALNAAYFHVLRPDQDRVLDARRRRRRRRRARHAAARHSCRWSSPYRRSAR